MMPPPVVVPPPLMQLTGGMKFAYLVVGAFMGIAGIVLSWLINADKVAKVKTDAVKFAVIGFVLRFAFAFLVSVLSSLLVATIVNTITSAII